MNEPTSLLSLSDMTSMVTPAPQDVTTDELHRGTRRESSVRDAPRRQDDALAGILSR